MKYHAFQVIAFLGVVPQSIIISNEVEPVLTKYTEMHEAGGDGFERIEFWAKGVMRSKKTYTDGKANELDIAAAASVLIGANPSIRAKAEQVPEILVAGAVPASPPDSKVSTPPNDPEAKDDTKDEQDDDIETDTDIDISPAALKLAKEHNIDITKVVGSGTEGKITKVDIEKLL